MELETQHLIQERNDSISELAYEIMSLSSTITETISEQQHTPEVQTDPQWSKGYQPKNPWGPESKVKLQTLEPTLVFFSNKMADIFNITCLWGHRGQALQDMMYQKGTGLPWPTSEHNSYPSKAVDLIPYPIGEDWDKHIPEFDMMVGAGLAIIEEHDLPIRSGKFFSNRADYAHWELTG